MPRTNFTSYEVGILSIELSSCSGSLSSDYSLSFDYSPVESVTLAACSTCREAFALINDGLLAGFFRRLPQICESLLQLAQLADPSRGN